MSVNLKEVSKGSFSLSHTGNPTLEEVNTSCLIRIADASEKMAANYSQMQSELERYKNYHQNNTRTITRLEKSNAALRGVITRMKNKGESK